MRCNFKIQRHLDLERPMFKKSMLAITLLGATTGVAAAQGTDLGGDVTPPPVVAPNPTPMTPAGSAGGFYEKGTLGISVPFLSFSNIFGLAVGEPVPTVDIVYFLNDKAALDLIAGINLHKEQVSAGAPPVTSDQTTFGFAVGVGYRMYKHHSSKVHSFIEPQLVLDWPDSSSGDALQLRLAGNFGLEAALTDWFSFSGTVGVGLNFANSFKDIQLATQSSLAANFYWK
jgi:hypothetical protein